MATEGSQYQHICEGCDFTEVTHICDTCPMYLCDRCTESHKRVKSTRNHSLRNAPNQETHSSAEPVPTCCAAHPAHNITLYCDTCDDILCTQCQRSSHGKHSVVPIVASKKKMQKLCIEYLSRLFDTTSTVQLDDKDAVLLKDKHISGLQKVKAELHNRKQKLQSCIETTYKASVSEVDAEIARAQIGFDDMMKQKNQTVDQAKELDAKLGSVRRHDDVDSLIDALSQFKLVYPEIQKVNDMDFSSLLSLQPEKLLQPNEKIDETIMSVKKVLGINKESSPQPVVQKTVVSTKENTVAGKPVSTANQNSESSKQEMVFHNVCGKNISMSGDRRHARRIKHHNFGICFGSRPVNINERIYVKVTETMEVYGGAAAFGLTSLDPNKLDNPMSICTIIDTQIAKFTWYNRGNAFESLSKYNEKETEFCFYVNSNGNVMYGVNGQEKGVLFRVGDTSVKLWPNIDIFAKTVAMEFVKK